MAMNKKKTLFQMSGCRLKSFLFFLCVFCMPYSAAAANYESNYWDSKSVVELKKMSDYYVTKKIKPDSALFFTTLIVSRLEKQNKLSPDERRMITIGYSNCAYLYSIHFSDYLRAMECLLKAQDYCNDPSLQINIDLNLGLIYNIYAECYPSEENIKVAHEIFKKTFHKSVELKDWDNVATSFVNMWNSGFNNEYYTRFSEEIKMLGELQIPKTITYYDYLMSMYHVVIDIRNKDYHAAKNSIVRQLKSIPPNESSSRLRCVAYWELALVYKQLNEPDSILKYVRRIEQLSQREHMEDVRLCSTKLLLEYYKEYGTDDNVLAQKLRFFEQRDSLLNAYNLNNVKSYGLLSNIRDLTHKVDNLQRINRLHNMITVLVFIGILLVISLLLVFYRRNKLLAAHNRLLYKQVQDKLNDDKPKYGKSNLTEGDKNILARRIEIIFQDKDEIYNEEFSLDRLSNLCESHYKDVSQAINEVFGKSFTLLLSEYRIKEACRRLNDKQNYGMFTVEAIGHSVGFKSRTGFGSAFKRVTGLSPSEYMKIAKEQGNA